MDIWTLKQILYPQNSNNKAFAISKIYRRICIWGECYENCSVWNCSCKSVLLFMLLTYWWIHSKEYAVANKLKNGVTLWLLPLELIFCPCDCWRTAWLSLAGLGMVKSFQSLGWLSPHFRNSFQYFSSSGDSLETFGCPQVPETDSIYGTHVFWVGTCPWVI